MEPDTSTRKTRFEAGRSRPMSRAWRCTRARRCRGWPGAGGNLHLHRKRMLCPWLRPLIRRWEIIHQLLDAHRVRRRTRVLVQKAPHIRIRGRVHINREGGKRLALHIEQAVLNDAGVGFVRVVRPAKTARFIRRGVQIGRRSPPEYWLVLRQPWLCLREPRRR